MTKSTNIECNGCKISMFCSRKDKEKSEPCDTNLKAVLIAFVIPLIGIVLLLAVAQGRVGEGYQALGILVFLALYFLLIRIIRPNFSK
jgi:hypothetical protein